LLLFIVRLDAAVVVARADDEGADLVVEVNVLVVAFDEFDIEVDLIVELPLLPEPVTHDGVAGL